ncbi:TlpA disulfide reductase family protein [Nonlabens marinus]|uniref:Thioredoxin domain-containing protein n=1 Tax=Nonlabens marinus S1-08 TaxID=1454201 RepID=W8VN29_9FLAO|nr:TlpA disulfide reductase family protein [Nonlabens marinus]BAO54179.1 hypothetical protein NMS_0170 [Nonlabens marinus S1-08]
MRVIYIVLLFVIITACSEKEVSTTQIVQRDFLTQLINEPSTEKVQVINFWATWCAPCVEELPAFVAIDERDDVEVILISLDEAKNVESLVNPFLVTNKITSTVKLLDDPYAAEWIPMVDEHWDGAIPATLIQKGSKKMFYNHSFTTNELEEEVSKFL